MTFSEIRLEEHTSMPKYKQIANIIEQMIVDGDLISGVKLPTHRKQADELGVTVGTVTRAYEELERRGLVEARVGAGTYVLDPSKEFWTFAKEKKHSHTECDFGFNVPPVVDRSSVMQEALSRVAQSPQFLNQLMNYQDSLGIKPHKEVMASWLQAKGVQVDADKMLLSSGGQHALQMVLDAFTSAGETVLAEEQTYPGLISLARQKKLSIKGVKMDAEGIVPDALDVACRQFQARFIYLTPTLQNPTASTMSVQRREEILEVCRAHDLYVIEDDVNGLLLDNPPPPMVNLDVERVFYIGSFSKCVAPGLRVGYVQPPQKFYHALSLTLQNHSWMISPLLTAVTSELLTNSKTRKMQNEIKSEMQKRIELAVSYLQEFNPQYNEDCFHMWLMLPEHWRLTDFINQAKAENVIVESAELFTPLGGNIVPAIRLALSSPLSREEMEYGLKTLQKLLTSESTADYSF